MTVEEIKMLAALRALECEKKTIEAELKVYAAQAGVLIMGHAADLAMQNIINCQRELVELARKFRDLSEVAEESEESADGGDSGQ